MNLLRDRNVLRDRRVCSSSKLCQPGRSRVEQLEFVKGLAGIRRTALSNSGIGARDQAIDAALPHAELETLPLLA